MFILVILIFTYLKKEPQIFSKIKCFLLVDAPGKLRTDDDVGGVVGRLGETVVGLLATAVGVEEVGPVIAGQAGGTARTPTATGGAGGAGAGGAGGRGGAGRGGGGAGVGTAPSAEHPTLA